MKFLYDFPKQAGFGKVLPKNKIYEHSSSSAKFKGLFVREVEKIICSYKLSPKTVNLPVKGGVREIQVLTIALKTGTLKREVLQSIDKAILYPTLFVLAFKGKMRYAAAYKRQSEADKSKWVISSYFESNWLSENAERAALPVVLDLGALYEKILLSLIDMPIRSNEKMEEFISRLDMLKMKERELSKLSARLKKEKQFNRRVDINRLFNELKKEIQRLKR